MRDPDDDLPDPDPDVVDRLIDVEKTLVRVRSDKAVTRALAIKHKVSQASAARWVTQVREQWAKESRAVSHREDQRDRMRATLDHCVELCLGRTKLVYNEDGELVIDRETGRPVVKNEPDVRTALRAIAQLRALDGLDQPIKHSVAVTTEWDRMSDEELARIAGQADAVFERAERRVIAAAKNGSGSADGGVNGPAT